MDVQLSTVDQSRTTPQGGTPAGLFSSASTSRRSVMKCDEDLLVRYTLLMFVSTPGDIMVQQTDVNCAIGFPGSPPLVLNLS